MLKKEVKRKCKQCGKYFECSRYSKQKFCNPIHREIFYNRLKEENRINNIDLSEVELKEKLFFKMIGRNIKGERKAKGLTLRELAAKANVNPGYLSTVENNKAKISLSTLFRVMEVLDLIIIFFDKKTDVLRTKQIINKSSETG